jgi:2-polyprenyl-3-methyl-5-hydroxy-6-metoxy-1,4-benzoquinol methylase
MIAVSHCALCGSADLRPSALSAWQPGMLHFAQARCAACGLIISQPRATGDEITRYYRDEYYGRHWPDGDANVASNRAFYLQHEIPLMRRLWAGRPPAPGESFFEVGCGYGAFLAIMAEAGHPVGGCDLSADAVAFCRSRGLDVVQGGVPGVVPPRPSDIVVCQHVIEHVEDPRAFVGALVSLTTPGGLVVIVTEDAWSAQHEWTVTRDRMRGRIPQFHTATDHTFVFRAEHLRRLMTEAGCTDIATASFSYRASGESLHWRLFKMAMRGIDRLTGHGEFLIAVGRRAH